MGMFSSKKSEGHEHHTFSGKPSACPACGGQKCRCKEVIEAQEKSFARRGINRTYDHRAGKWVDG